MDHYVYILVSEIDGTLYTGQTSNLISRLERHNEGLIKSTKAKGPYKLGYSPQSKYSFFRQISVLNDAS